MRDKKTKNIRDKKKPGVLVSGHHPHLPVCGWNPRIIYSPPAEGLAAREDGARQVIPLILRLPILTLNI